MQQDRVVEDSIKQQERAADNNVGQTDEVRGGRQIETNGSTLLELKILGVLIHGNICHPTGICPNQAEVASPTTSR